MGLASALLAQLFFFFFCGEKALKNALYKTFSQTKVVTYQKLQLLCCVTFFDILSHFGVIAAYGKHQESFVPSYGTDFFFKYANGINLRQLFGDYSTVSVVYLKFLIPT